MSGRELSRRFYERMVSPLIVPTLGSAPHAAAMLGDGSDVLGFDDDVSPDHDFGARVQLFLQASADPGPLLAALESLPDQFEGFPVYYCHDTAPSGWIEGQPAVTTAEEFFTARLGFDPATGIGLAHWLTTPTQILATLVYGEVFHDPAGLLAGRRAAMTWYPDDVWRYVLAAAWLRVDQEEPFVGRTGGSGDDLGSRIITARLARDLTKLAFLAERRWAPYSKWLGRAFSELSLAARLTPVLTQALAATGWRKREKTLGAASQILAEATNALRLAEPVDPTPRQFWARDLHVLGAHRFVQALADSVSDPAVRTLIDDLGCRMDGIYRLPGAIDQAIDSVDVLTNPGLRRASARTLGLVS